MKKTVRRILSVILAAAVAFTVFPSVVFAFDEATHYATPEIASYADTVFTETVIIDSTDDYNGLIEFDNCTFEQGIVFLAGKTYMAEFHGNCTVNGTVKVINQTFEDISDKSLGIFYLPDNTVFEIDALCDATIIGDSQWTYTINGMELIGSGDSLANMFINLHYDWFGWDYHSSLYVSNAGTINVNELNFNRIIASSLNEHDTEINLAGSDWSTFPDYIELEGTYDINYGCTCDGDEACECACCSAHGCKGGECKYTCFDESDAECACRNSVPEDFTPGKLIVNGETDGISVAVSGDIDVSNLNVTNAGIYVDCSYYRPQSIEAGSNCLAFAGNGSESIAITAQSGAEIDNSAGVSNPVTVNGISYSAAIDENGTVVIPLTDSDILYTLYNFINGEGIGFETFADECYTYLVPDSPLVIYTVEAVKDGVVYTFPAMRGNYLLASSNETYYEGMVFDSPVTILAMGEAYDVYAGIRFNNCTFNDTVTVDAGNCFLDINFDVQRDENGSVIPENNCVFNAPIELHGGESMSFQDCVVRLNDAPDVEINTNNTSLALGGCCNGSTFTVDGMVIETYDDADSGLWIDYRRECRAEHEGYYEAYDHTSCEGDTYRSLFIDGGLKSIYIPETAPVISSIEANNLIDDAVMDIHQTQTAVDCLCIRSNSYDEELYDSALKVTGETASGEIEVSGKLDLSELAADGIIRICPQNPCDIDIGSKNAYVGSSWETEPVSVTAADGSYFVNERADISVTFNGICFDGSYIGSNGSIFIPVTDNSLQYKVFDGDNEIAVTADCTENGTVLSPQEDTDLVLCAIEVNDGGAKYNYRAVRENFLIAAPDGNEYADRVFTDRQTIIGIGDDYNNISFVNCDFENGFTVLQRSRESIFIDFPVYRDEYDEIMHEYDSTVNGEVTVSGNIETAFEFSRITFNNAPDMTVVSQDVPYDVCGNGEAHYTLNGAVVNSVDSDEDDFFRFEFCRNCYAPHDYDYNSYDHLLCESEKSLELGCSGSIGSVCVDDSSEIATVMFNGVIDSASLEIYKETAIDGILRVRSNNWEREPAEISITGEIKNNSLELDGQIIDISDLAFNADDDERKIYIGTWNENNTVIGSHSVELSGGGENTANFTAESGAGIITEFDRFGLNINGNSFEIGQPHIFGTEGNYNVYIGTADRSINYGLLVNGEPVDFDTEYIDDEEKTHLRPAESQYDCGDWWLEAEKDGITVFGRVRHKSDFCEHEFGDWILTDEGNCCNDGVEVRFCPYCELAEYRNVQGNADIHDFECIITNHEHENHEGFFRCRLCGLETDTVDGMELVDYGCELCLFSTENIDGVNTIVNSRANFYDTYVPNCVNGEDVAALGESAFAGHTDIHNLEIAPGITSIGAFCFADCGNLKKVTIPDSITEIGENAFDGCSEDLVIICSEGSCAQQYAQANGIKCVCLPFTVRPSASVDVDARVIFTHAFNITDFAADVADYDKTDSEISVVPSVRISKGNYRYGTGSVISFYLNNELTEYTLVVNGDLDGDSAIDVLDIALAERFCNNHGAPTAEQIYAAAGYAAEEIDVNCLQNIVNRALKS